MRKPTAADILNFTFNHLEKVLKENRDDRDGFIRQTAVQADTLYTRPDRAEKSRHERQRAGGKKPE